MTSIQLTADMIETVEAGMLRFKKVYVLVLADGRYWRGNGAKPVKTKACAGLITLKEGQAMCAAYPSETRCVRPYSDR